MFRNFFPDNFEYCLNNEHFHCLEKGCEMETIENYSLDDKLKHEDAECHSYHQMCHTHNILCSKTGWALHHYNGQDNRNLFIMGTCLRCGKTYYSTNKEKIYCKRCQKAMEIIYREENNIPLDRRQEVAMKNYLKRIGKQ